MRLVIQEHKPDVADWAAKYVKQKINDHEPTEDRPFLLGLPTGSTPKGMYSKLIEMYENDEVSFKHVVTFNMDEYVFPTTSKDKPCAKNPNSYHYYMWDNFFQHIDIKPENVHILDGDTDDIRQECTNFEKKIVEASKGQGGIHLFVGGIGPDGHVAFNEPGSSLNSRTREKTLAYDTVLANRDHFTPVRWDDDAEDPISSTVNGSHRGSRFAGNNNPGDPGRVVANKGMFVEVPKDKLTKHDKETAAVPHTALTVGVGTVMDAKEVMILVTGQPKALALAKCIEEGVSHQWTVSMVQLHEHAIIVCDEPATVEMRVRTVDYYKGLADLHNKMLGEDNPDLRRKRRSNSRDRGMSEASHKAADFVAEKVESRRKPSRISPSEGGASLGMVPMLAVGAAFVVGVTMGRFLRR